MGSEMCIRDRAGGYLQSYALRADGTVWAWGYNEQGQLGDTTVVHRSAPVQVVGLTGVVDLSGGYFHALALLDNGSLRSWGVNSQGQLGSGTASIISRPIQVP